MKKRYLLPIFVVVGLVSLAGAKDCLVNGDKAYCKWAACNAIDPTYAQDPATATCQGEVDNCNAYGELYTDASCTGPMIAKGATYTVTESGLSDDRCTGYYCDWGTCGEITTDKNNTSNPILTCTDAITNCAKNSSKKTVFSNSTCTTPHPNVDQGVNCSAWCMWDACYAISPDDCSTAAPGSDCTPTSTCQEAIANCAANSDSKTAYSNGTCTAPISPIISGTSLAGLTVLANNGSLHISSLKDATVSLFDMQGKQVFGTKVAAGYNVLALKDQRMGVYYAVVQSGSSKQIVKVTVK